MTYTEARARATAAILEGWAEWVGDEVRAIAATGIAPEEAGRIFNSAWACADGSARLNSAIVKMTRLLLDPSAPGRLQ